MGNILHCIYEGVKALKPKREGIGMKFDKNDVINATQNNKEAFANLYDSIYVDLFKMAFYIMGNRELAEDVVGETILDAYRGISGMKEESNFENWILKLLTNKCKKSLRNKYNKFSIFNSNARNIDDYALASEDKISVYEDKTDISRAMSKLSALDRIIISLCIVEGYKSYEVADILSMKPTTVRSRLNRGLAKMKNYLEVK